VVPDAAVSGVSGVTADLDVRPASLTLHRVRLTLEVPHRAAHGTVSDRDLILVQWTNASGVVGWGECPALSAPTYVPETTDVAWAALRDRWCPAAMVGGLDPMPPSMATASLADARFDAGLRTRGASAAGVVGESLSTSPSATVAMCQVIDLGVDLDALVIEPGVTMVKAKVTPESIERVRVLAERLAGPMTCALDANGSFGGASDVPPWVDDLGLMFIEQPFAVGNEGAASELRRRGLAVAWDESVNGRARLLTLIDDSLCDVVSIKPSRVGGVVTACSVALLASERELPWFVGGMLEGGIGRAAALAMAASSSLPTDLGPSVRYFREDICEPVVAHESGLVVPGGAGWGRVPDADRLAATTVDQLTWE